jgi:catechol 2,3-dioxygenase-like lactoylglutathione lyase family enzyme
VAFYEPFLNFMGLRTVIKADDWLYCVGGRTACGIQPGDRKLGERFEQKHIGLHHVCFRARERADVDTIHEFVQDLGATIVHPPREDAWAPGYYSVLFEDPEGIRLEVNHVPGKGLLADKEKSGAPRLPPSA